MNYFFKLMLKILAVFLLCFSIFFFWASSSTVDETEYEKLITNSHPKIKTNDSVFNIITYNIGYLSGMTNNLPIAKPKSLFNNNLKKVIKETKRVNPDIIAFQEIDYNASRSYQINQESEIAKLGYNYIARGVNWDEQYVPFPYWPPNMHFSKIVSGQSILSKYKLKDYERIVLQRNSNTPFYKDAFYLERLAQVCKVILNQKEVVLINVHLEAFDKPTRTKQFRFVIDKIFKKYKDKYPTILLGDFNSEARDEKAVIKELFTMKGIGNADFNTENISNTYNTKNPLIRIDYIFYTEKSIEYIDGRVLNEFEQASDHLPVMMKFRLK